jgi:hypothetical protein
MEQTFSFTVKLSHPVYVALLNESKTREKSTGAVPSRTARQLIEERLEEINKPTIGSAMTIDHPAAPLNVAGVATEDEPKQKAKKPRSRKVEDGADESAPA